MATIDEAIDSIEAEAVRLVKDQLRNFLKAASDDTDEVIKETGSKIAEWLLQRAQGRLSDQEFEALLYSRDQYLRQYKNSLDIKARARLEEIAVGLINLVLDKVLSIAG
jgi:ElaB/YqjD/DUF883 family membrane-anchored ribosome-binding protein